MLRHYVAPEHFRTLGVPLLRGRIFTPTDRAGAGRVAIINQLAADRFFAGENPIGQRVWFGGGSNFDRPDSAAEIVGVVGNVAYQTLDERPMQPDFYTPYAQFTYAARAVIVRTSHNPAVLASGIRHAVANVEPSLAITELRTIAADDLLQCRRTGRTFVATTNERAQTDGGDDDTDALNEWCAAHTPSDEQTPCHGFSATSPSIGREIAVRRIGRGQMSGWAPPYPIPRMPQFLRRRVPF